MRFLGIAAGVLVFLAAVAFVGVTLWIGTYVRSDRFRGRVAEATGTAFDASAGFDPFRWTGSSVYSESAELRGRPGSALGKIEARQLRAEVDWRAAFSGLWRVDEISIARLEGNWSPNPKTSPAAEPRAASQSPGGIATLLPHRFELGVLKIGAANLAFDGVKLSDSALTVRPDGSGWLFQGSGGELALPWPPALPITGFRVREQGGDYFLTEGNLRLGENGRITATGESSGGGKLQISWEGVKTSDVLPGAWRRQLDGVLSGNALITFPNRVTGTFQLQDGRLEEVPLLVTVADFTGNPAFRRMPIQKVSGDFSWENGLLKITNFSAESKGHLRVDGSMIIGAKGPIDGTFQIGVSPQTLQWLPGSRTRVFTDSRGGYVWTEVKVGGTLDFPTENLSPRLAAAMGDEVIQQGTNLINATPGAAVEGVRGVLDILRPIVP